MNSVILCRSSLFFCVVKLCSLLQPKSDRWIPDTMLEKKKRRRKKAAQNIRFYFILYENLTPTFREMSIVFIWIEHKKNHQSFFLPLRNRVRWESIRDRVGSWPRCESSALESQSCLEDTNHEQPLLSIQIEIVMGEEEGKKANIQWSSRELAIRRRI